MKTTDKILFSPKEGTTGFWGLRNVPKEPNSNSPAYHPIDNTLYENALESCKSNSLEIVNPEVMGFDQTYFLPKSGDIFDLPGGYEFKQEDICGYNGELCHVTCNHCASYSKTILRLVKTETFKDRFDNVCVRCEFPAKFDGDGRKRCIHCGTIAGEVPQPEPEESQTELELIDFFRPYFTEVSNHCRRGHNLNGRKMSGPDVDKLLAKIRKDILKVFTIQRKKQ